MPCLGVAYLGNLTCRDCGLTFTSKWGSEAQADEYRCDNDHVVHVEPAAGTIVAVDGALWPQPATITRLRGLCPVCRTELATGRLPQCPVCGGSDHDIQLAGILT